MRGSVRSAAASVAGTLAILLVVEGLLRVTGIGAGYWDRGLPPTVMRDPDLRLRLRPSSRMESRHSGLIVVSSRGTRGPEFAVPKPPGLHRIVAVGDSVTFGWGVAEADAFPAVLGRALAERGVEVVNAGQPSFSSAQGLRYLERDLLGYAPDVVLFCFGHNDAFMTARSDRQEAASRRRQVRRMQELLRGSRIYTALAGLLVGGPSSADPALSLGAPVGSVPRATPEELADNLRAATDACRRAGARIVFLTQPRRNRTPSLHADAVRRTGRELGVPVVDLEQLFAPLAPEPLFVDNVHPSAAGHLLFAQETGRVLEAAGLLPAPGGQR